MRGVGEKWGSGSGCLAGFRSSGWRNGLCLLVVSWMLLRWGGEGSEAVRQGMELCEKVIVPAMFPFFILSNMVISLGLSQGIGRLLSPFMMPLFHLSGRCGTAILLGLVGGYPVGAKTAVELYELGQCTKEEGNHLLRFCNSGGPAFLCGVIATGMYHSMEVGLLLYGAHLGAAVTVGVLFRPSEKESLRMSEGEQTATISNSSVTKQESSKSSSKESSKSPSASPSFLSAFVQGVTGAMDTTLAVCAFILCFTVLLRLFRLSGVLTLLSRLLTPLFLLLGWEVTGVETLVVGFFELASGVSAVSGGTVPEQMAILSFCLGWGGLCVHGQVLSFLLDSGLSCKSYLLGSLWKGFFASIYGFLLATFCLGSEVSPVVATMGQGTVGVSSAFWWGLLFCLGSTTCLVLGSCFVAGKKNLQKRGRKIHKKGVY